jgi:ApbE superfamily uncharacterized protein (UPF0280 family)
MQCVTRATSCFAALLMLTVGPAAAVAGTFAEMVCRVPAHANAIVLIDAEGHTCALCRTTASGVAIELTRVRR